MITACEASLSEYDYKMSVSVKVDSRKQDQDKVRDNKKKMKNKAMAGGGWEIVILEAAMNVTSALTLTFQAPQLKTITINLCKVLIYLFL